MSYKKFAIILSLIFLSFKPLSASEGQLQIQVAKLVNAENNFLFVSTGVPFTPGQIFSDKDFSIFDQNGQELRIAVKTLAKWQSDGSIRSLLVQFSYVVDKKYAPVTIKWGYARKSEDLPVKDIGQTLPEGYLVLPAKWLCGSLIIGEQVPMGNNPYSKLTERNYLFPKYDENIKKIYSLLEEKKVTGDIRNDGYYDITHVLYQLYVRSGDIEFLKAARKEALKYRNEIIQGGPERGRHNTYRQSRYVYVEGMADDYLLMGDSTSLQVASYMAEYLKKAFPLEKYFYQKNSSRFWTEREAAFPFLGIAVYYELAGNQEDLEYTNKIMQNLYRTQKEWPQKGGFIHNLYAHDPEEGARKDEYGGSPFMTGLVLEAIVKYHQITKSEIAKDSIFMALDWLIKDCLAPDERSFIYLTCDNSRGRGHPDLNLLIAHAFGYGYKISGYTRKEYLELGKKVFEEGVNKAYLGDRKHFNQNYRSSGHFLAYISQQDTKTINDLKNN